MKIEELRKTLSDSPNSEWLFRVSTPITLPSVDFQNDFIGIPALYEFLNEQCSGWESMNEEVRNNFNQSYRFFIDFRESLSHLLNSILSATEVQRNQLWDNNILQRTYKNLRDIFVYNSQEVKFLIQVLKDYPTAYPGAYSFIVGSVSSTVVSNRENLIGSILAYEFTLKNLSQISERRNAEKLSINSMRNKLSKFTSDNEIYLRDFNENLEQELTGHSEAIQTLQAAKTKELDDLRQDKDNAFEDWFRESTKEYKKLFDDAESKKNELENTYSEKLKLEEPAKYWSNRAADLKKQAWRAMYILIGLTILSALFLGVILWNSPDSILASWFNNDKSAAIRWSLVFITLLSLIAYGIRAISKVMFSSFHLARDCEERYTLTYFYLALMKDSNVDPKNSSLIMQSLFSRSDTGLLKEDSSPTMPGNVGGVVSSLIK